MSEPFLALVKNIVLAIYFRGVQLELDLFCAENETLAARIVLNIVSALVAAGADLGTSKIQTAINTAREDTIALLNQRGR
jgi:hypothetical protein